jgi:hypothetical protein
MIPAVPEARAAGLGGRSSAARQRLKNRIENAVLAARFMLVPWLRSSWSSRGLAHLSGPPTPRRRRGVVAVTPYYGNHQMLPVFLRHHRRLGVDEFVFLDLSEDGNLSVRLADAKDCAVWRPHGAIDPAGSIHWLNFLRRRYATGRWCLSLEPTDLFVFARSEQRQIKDLVEFIESEHRDHLFALVIDMYGERPAENLALRRGQHPLDKLCWFDALGDVTSWPGRNRSATVRGGVQRRTLYAAAPRQSPALNRIPLVKWRRFHAYVAGTRVLMPRRINTAHTPWHTSPTACLLRFALLDDERVLSAAARAEAVQIVADAGGPGYAGVPALRSRHLKQDISVRFTSSADLVECGLLNPGQWF